jgi:hypothetical protein
MEPDVTFSTRQHSVAVQEYVTPLFPIVTSDKLPQRNRVVQFVLLFCAFRIAVFQPSEFLGAVVSRHGRRTALEIT